MRVPVKLALIWSKPLAVMPFSGQLMKYAETGGWCEVCSVKYEILSGDFNLVLLVPGPSNEGLVSWISQLHCED